jgi:hypothetical protein
MARVRSRLSRTLPAGNSPRHSAVCDAMELGGVRSSWPTGIRPAAESNYRIGGRGARK